MKKRLLSIVLGAFMLIGIGSVQAQDPHFTQFSHAPMHLNPALTGVYSGSFRLVANYRNQWSSVFGSNAFRTYAAGFDMRFFGIGKDYVSVGIHILSDQAGESEFNLTQGHLSISYLKQLSGNSRWGTAQYLVAGAQLGLGQHGVNWDAMRFSLQFDGDAFNPNLPSGENFGQQSRAYVDINAGLLWYAIFDERQSIYVGASAHHINAPDISFYDNQTESLLVKFSGIVGGEIPLGDYLSVLPAGMFMKQGPSMEIMAGANLRYRNNDWNTVALRAGLWGRVVGKYGNGIGTDAVAVTAGIEIERFQIIASYDINTSTLIAASNRRGAFELSFKYTHPPQSRGELRCPKF
ncbi:MAG: PorP/SprF family type IX secretion system membrane protein [Bacteroidota bacterium]